MKELIAVIRAKRMNATKDALQAAGFGSMTAQVVRGRGKQLGLMGEFSHPVPTPDAEHMPPPSFISKRMLTLLIEEGDVPAAVEAIMSANRTGSPGDGKIFVSSLGEIQRVRTGEQGIEAI